MDIVDKLHELKHEYSLLNSDNTYNKKNIKNYKDTLNKILDINSLQSKTLKELRSDLDLLTDSNIQCSADTKKLTNDKNELEHKNTVKLILNIILIVLVFSLSCLIIYLIINKRSKPETEVIETEVTKTTSLI